jgi:hypothetical protein
MTTGYGNPFRDKPSQPPKKDPWYENPWWYCKLTGFFVLAMVLMANGVFIQGTCALVALAIATGWYTFTEIPNYAKLFDPDAEYNA